MQNDSDLVNEQLLLTIPQVARSLGVSRAMVYVLIAKKDGIPVVRLGRAVRVSMASLRKWVEKQEQTS